MPLLLAIDPLRPAPETLAQAAAVLAKGGVAICPTETLYGLAVDSDNPMALARLAAIKQRPADKPFPLIIGLAEQVDSLVKDVPPVARRLMASHWPGPLTIICPARPDLMPELTHQGGVALRHSPHPVAAGLAMALGRAITATSANLTGQPAPAAPEQFDPRLLELIDLVLDAGPCPGGPPSTIIDARPALPLVLRAGALDLGQP